MTDKPVFGKKVKKPYDRRNSLDLFVKSHDQRAEQRKQSKTGLFSKEKATAIVHKWF